MKKLLYIIAFLAPNWAFAQLHKNLDSLEVYAQKSVADAHVYSFDSNLIQFSKSENLGDILQKHSAINVNVNGFFGQVSSPASGGLGSDHVKIHWEGVELNQLTLGSFDLSLFPTFLASGISINSGSDFNTLGGNASGLGVNIETSKRVANQLEFETGSFAHYRTSARVAQQIGRTHLVVQPYFISSENNFEYQEKGPREVLTKESKHNALEQFGWMTNLAVGSKFRAGMWSQNRKKQLPLTLQQNGIAAGLQLDNNMRLFARYNPSTHWEWQGDFSRDDLQYRDKLGNELDYSINSKINLQRWGNHLRYRFYAKHFKFQAQSQLLHYWVNSSGFGKKIEQWRTQNQFSAEYKNKAWYGRVASKLQAIEGQKWRNTIMASVGYAFQNTTVSYGINQRFKAPDFNDLYWANGGNPDLKNEEGWSHFAFISRQAKWNTELKFTHTELKNKIQWIPNGRNWSPINLQQLRSFAVDAKVGRQWKIKDRLFGLDAFANHTRANEWDTNREDYAEEQVIFCASV